MKSRVLLITGGSGKFGRSLVEYFLGIGDIVAFTASSEQSVSDVLSDYPEAKGRLHGFAQDFSEVGFADSLLEQLSEQGIYPSCLVNNARSLKFLQVDKGGVVSRDNFLGEYLIDVFAPYELTMKLSKYVDSQLKYVVNIGSQYGSNAVNPSLYDEPLSQSPIHYGVAKAALEQLTRELAVRLIDYKIQVNCVAFGGVEGRVDRGFKERYQKLVPLGRMLREDEVVGPIAYLLSSMSSGMTGQTMSVDGGWGIW